MKALENLLDAYNLRARLLPMLLTLLPLGLSVASWIPVDYSVLGTVGSMAVTLGVATILQQLARDAGKRREEWLFALWGGRPSVRMLSYAHSDINLQTLARYHTRLRAMVPSLKIPKNSVDEAKKSSTALETYESCNDLLLSATRDKDRFSLLFEENMNYGFRRNLWGLKPYGVAFSFFGLAATAARVSGIWGTDGDMSAIAVANPMVCVLFILLWISVVKPEWVRAAAWSYGRRLVESCEHLQPAKKKEA